jgi:hypothetical protein
MKKESHYRAILHLFPRRSLLVDHKNRRISCDISHRTSDKIIPRYLSSKKSSQISILAKFCYEKILKKCMPENLRIDQDENQQIDIDLLYPYDPFHSEVGNDVY